MRMLCTILFCLILVASAFQRSSAQDFDIAIEEIISPVTLSEVAEPSRHNTLSSPGPKGILFLSRLKSGGNQDSIPLLSIIEITLPMEWIEHSGLRWIR